VNKGPQYERRAMECLAFAQKAPTDEERSCFLAMADTLKRIAAEREKKFHKARQQD
jgi:hypothetical protein